MTMSINGDQLVKGKIKYIHYQKTGLESVGKLWNFLVPWHTPGELED